MDFVSKALGSLALGLPFTLGDEVPLDAQSPQPWRLYRGTLKKDAMPVSVFDYADENQAAAATATAVLRKLKLPGVVKHVDTVESGRHTYVVTEAVAPLSANELSDDARRFVLFSLLQTLANIHTVARCSHNNVGRGTLMQAQQTGAFVLVGFEFATLDGAPVPLAISTATRAAAPPEGWSTPTLDTYQFGALVGELLPSEARLVAALRPQRRPTIAKLAASQSAQTSLRNPVTEIVANIPHAPLMPAHELEKLCRQIDASTDALYSGIIEHTILPELIKVNKPETFRTNIVLISRLREPLSDDGVITTYLVQQFSSLDRVVRLELLRHMPQYMPLLSDKTVQQQIMPKMAFGFADTEAVVRKSSIAAIECMTDKLNSRQLNSELLRMLAKTHSDPDPEIRALTTTVLCRLAPKLDNRSVISTALGRALKDPEPSCRRAALQGVTTIDVPIREIAEKLLGPAAGGMLDSNPEVAQEASKVTEYLVRKIRQTAKLEAPPPPDSDDAVRRPSVPPNVPTPISTLNSATLPEAAENATIARPVARRGFGSHAAKPDGFAQAQSAPSSDVAEDGANDADAQEAAETANAWAWDDDEGQANEAIEVDEDAWGW